MKHIFYILIRMIFSFVAQGFICLRETMIRKFKSWEVTNDCRRLEIIEYRPCSGQGFCPNITNLHTWKVGYLILVAAHCYASDLKRE